MTEWALQLTDTLGYLGLATVGFLVRILPPLPPEAVLPLAGFHAAQARRSLAATLAAGAIGQMLGVLVWYWASRAFGRARVMAFLARHGRWLTLAPADADAALAWFERHGDKAVLIGQLFPGIRTLVAIPAGVTCMRLGRFMAYAGVGTIGWTLVLLGGGYVLMDDWPRLGTWLSPLSRIVAVAIVAVYLLRIWRWRRGDR